MTIQGQGDRNSSSKYCPKSISIDQRYLGRILRYKYCLLRALTVGEFENVVEKNYNSVTTLFSGSYD